MWSWVKLLPDVYLSFICNLAIHGPKEHSWKTLWHPAYKPAYHMPTPWDWHVALLLGSLRYTWNLFLGLKTAHLQDTHTHTHLFCRPSIRDQDAAAIPAVTVFWVFVHLAPKNVDDAGWLNLCHGRQGHRLAPAESVLRECVAVNTFQGPDLTVYQDLDWLTSLTPGAMPILSVWGQKIYFQFLNVLSWLHRLADMHEKRILSKWEQPIPFFDRDIPISIFRPPNDGSARHEKLPFSNVFVALLIT